MSSPGFRSPQQATPSTISHSEQVIPSSIAGAVEDIDPGLATAISAAKRSGGKLMQSEDNVIQVI
jgi:hypothetical protein